ncbi:hypothetical protein FIBSPDRAFT_930341 [Athelia psychrophila]|uniref:Uncharacterized protein n=1 Tax=Athelia psychrophila TaxID=1759441 RepID=A0A166MCG6_9AGAM|nr:hypothetical protein FIBSPDRAFT_930341 [Fibularhizoctonia sp. CBS 109695]
MMHASAPTPPLLAANSKKSRWGPRPTVSSLDTHLKKDDVYNLHSPLPQNQRGPGIPVQIDHSAETSKVRPEASSPSELLTSLKQSSTFAKMVTSNDKQGSAGGKDTGNDAGTKEGFALSSQLNYTPGATLYQPVHPNSFSAVSGPTVKPEGLVRSQASPTKSSTPAEDVDALLTTRDSLTPHPTIAQLILQLKEMPKPLRSSITDPSSADERCRRLVAPLITQLAQARGSNTSKLGNGVSLEEEAMALMNSELCADFVDFAREVRAELRAKDPQDGYSVEGVVAGVKRGREEKDEGNKARTRTPASPSLSMASSSTSAIKVPPQAPRAMRQGVVGSYSNEASETSTSDARTRLPSSGHSSDTSRRPRPSQSHTYPRDQERPGRSTEARSSARQGGRKMSRESDGEIIDDRASLRQSRQGSRGMSRPPPLLQRSREGDLDRNLPQEHSRREHSRESNVLHDYHHYPSTKRGQSKEPGEVGNSPVVSDTRLPGPNRPRDDEEDGEVYDHGSGHFASRPDFPRIAGPPHQSLPTPPLTKSNSSSVTSRVEHQPREPVPQQSRYQDHSPRLWLAKVGLSQIDVLEAEFEVPPEIAICCEKAASSPVSMHLLSLPTAHVQGEYEKIEHSALPQVLANAMWNIKTQWPPSGSLIIQMKIGNTWSRSWLPEALGSDMPPLDVTAYIRPGTNHLRFIHLGDLSAYTFLIHSAPATLSKIKPPPNLDAIPPISPAPITSDQKRIDSEWDEYLNLSAQLKKPSLFNFAGAAVLLEH